jgi:hypothetical protein
MDFNGVTELLAAFDLNWNDQLDKVIYAKHYDNFDEHESRLAIIRIANTMRIVAMQLTEIADQR